MKLIILSAPSGAGKTTFCQRLLKDFPSRLVLSISSTTRKPRGQEKHGQEYFFIDMDEFRRGIKDGQFAEWAEVHGNFYGTSKKVIDDAFKAGKSVLLDIDVQGAASLREAYPDQCFDVFISPPSLEVLEQRLRARGTEQDTEIKKRLTNAKAEMTRSGEFKIVLVNQDLEQSYRRLKSLVEEQVFGAKRASGGGSRTS